MSLTVLRAELHALCITLLLHGKSFFAEDLTDLLSESSPVLRECVTSWWDTDSNAVCCSPIQKLN